jgi:hypothetical protein
MKKKICKYISVIGLIFIFVLLGMMPTIMPAIKKPADRVFNGMHGYLDDYVGYASYVKEGMYGLNTFRIRSLPKGQSSTSANLTYIWAGKVAKIFKWSAPFGYHVARAFLGAIFIYVTYVLFKLLTKSHTYAMLATIIAFTSSVPGWYFFENNQWVYKALSSFSFIDNVAGRVTTRPHYILGAILFIILIIRLIRENKLDLHGKLQITNYNLQTIVKKIRISKHFYQIINILIIAWNLFIDYWLLLILSFLLGITHPSFAILLLGVCGLYILIIEIPFLLKKRIGNKEKIMQLLLSHTMMILYGVIGGILLSKWSTSVEPYVSILSFEEYVYYERLSFQTVINDIKTFGPSLWIGFIGLLWMVIKTRGTSKKDIVMFLWIIVQYLLFFSLYSIFRAERFRFIQSLYFIPMAYGTIVVFRDIGQKLGKWVPYMGTIALLVVFIPTYINGFLTDYYANTDYKTYWSTLIFPTMGQMEAFDFLDKHTEKESTVITSFESGNQVIMYSHNYVVGNTQGWPKEKQKIMVPDRDNFYSGMLPISTALELVKKYDIQYVYNGWQEKTLGDVTRYPFLLKVFGNNEVEIYKVTK